MNNPNKQHRFDLSVRYFVYRFFVQHARPPSVSETAQMLDITLEQAHDAFQRLHKNHFFFLEPGSSRIRMANPLSAIRTDFQVHAGGQSYWANCAWDMLGIPAMLGSDASIVATCADCRKKITISVEKGKLQQRGEIVHFTVPFRNWYDDLIYT